VKIGDKVRIVNTDYIWDPRLANGVEGVISEVFYGPGDGTTLVSVKIEDYAPAGRDGWAFYTNQIQVIA